MSLKHGESPVTGWVYRVDVTGEVGVCESSDCDAYGWAYGYLRSPSGEWLGGFSSKKLTHIPQPGDDIRAFRKPVFPIEVKT